MVSRRSPSRPKRTKISDLRCSPSEKSGSPSGKLPSREPSGRIAITLGGPRFSGWVMVTERTNSPMGSKMETRPFDRS